MSQEAARNRPQLTAGTTVSHHQRSYVPKTSYLPNKLAINVPTARKTGANAPNVPRDDAGAISDRKTAWEFVPIPEKQPKSTVNRSINRGHRFSPMERPLTNRPKGRR